MVNAAVSLEARSEGLLDALRPLIIRCVWFSAERLADLPLAARIVHLPVMMRAFGTRFESFESFKWLYCCPQGWQGIFCGHFHYVTNRYIPKRRVEDALPGTDYEVHNFYERLFGLFASIATIVIVWKWWGVKRFREKGSWCSISVCLSTSFQAVYITTVKL